MKEELTLPTGVLGYPLGTQTECGIDFEEPVGYVTGYNFEQVVVNAINKLAILIREGK